MQRATIFLPLGTLGKKIVKLIGLFLLSIYKYCVYAIMNEKLKNTIANTAVLTMRGKLKKDESDEAELSCLEDEVLEGKFPVLIGK